MSSLEHFRRRTRSYAFQPLFGFVFRQIGEIELQVYAREILVFLVFCVDFYNSLIVFFDFIKLIPDVDLKRHDKVEYEVTR